MKAKRDVGGLKARPLNIKIGIEEWNWLEIEASQRRLAGDASASKTQIVTEAIRQLRQKLEGKKK